MGLILGILLVLSGFFRLPLLSVSPPELFGDEIDVGYQAYSLWITGKDMYGQVLPTYVHSLSEWRAPLLMYATVPSLAVFGLNEWGVRFPESIMGSLTPIILALVVWQLTKNRGLSILSGVILALTPWHIHYSRVAFEVVLMLNLALLGVLIYLKRRFVLSAVFMGLTLYTYSTALLFVPMLICGLTFFKGRPNMRGGVTLLIMLIPLGLSLISGTATRRFDSISIATKKEIIDEITENRKESGEVGRIFFNRPVRIATEGINNYLSSFSTQFLFVRGDPIFRHNQQYGELLPVFFPFLIMGVIFLVSQKQYWWLFWLIISPLPASLTDGGGWHATRLFWMLPPLVVSVAYGIYYLWVSRVKLVKILLLMALVVGCYQLAFQSYYYLNIYSQKSWQWWHVGYKDVMTKLTDLAPNYSHVYINNTYEPALTRFLFWSRYDPKLFQEKFVLDSPEGFVLDKYYFGSLKNAGLQSDGLYLLSSRDDSMPQAARILHITYNPYQEPIFYLVDFKP